MKSRKKSKIAGVIGALFIVLASVWVYMRSTLGTHAEFSKSRIDIACLDSIGIKSKSSAPGNSHILIPIEDVEYAKSECSVE